MLHRSLDPDQAPSAHRSSQTIAKLKRIAAGSETLERRLTAPVVATMLAARSKTVTSQPAFRRATAVETPPTLPPMMTTFVDIVITSAAVQSCILESSVQAAAKSKCQHGSLSIQRFHNNGSWARCRRKTGRIYSKTCSNSLVPALSARKSKQGMSSYFSRERSYDFT